MDKERLYDTKKITLQLLYCYTKTVSDHSTQVVNIVVLWVAGILYGAAVSGAKNILVSFQLMEPLHWSVAQVRK